MKTLVIALFFVAFAGTGLFAQVPAGRDSIINVAQRDAKTFKLSRAGLAVFKKGGTNYGGDIFKPNATTTADTTLLRDSVYVKTFKETAYNKYKRNQYSTRYTLFNGLFIAALTGVMVIVALNTNKN